MNLILSLKIKPKEIRRQVLHLLYGPVLIGLHSLGLNTHWLLGVLLVGILISGWIKHKQEGAWIGKIIALFERRHQFENFPGKGPLFFTLGAYLSLLIFPTAIAYASIMILSVGDSVSHLIGRYFGKVKTPFHPEKYIEGSIVAFLISVPFAFAFFPNLSAVILASLAAMIVELPDLKIGRLDIDDNLIIPLVAGGILSIF